MATQATDNLVVVDGMPSVEKLWNGRFRLEFFCTPSNKNEGWYSDNIAKWLPEFGTLQGADFTGEGWEALDGEVYPNMCLVEAEVPYIPPSESHLVKLVYETLTTAWVLEKDEDTDYELNGLKRVTRQSVALPDTAYTNIVGTTTIDSDGTTLYLGTYKIVETDAKWTLQEVWLEAGTLSTSKSSESDGVMSVTTVFFGVEGATVGPVIAKKTDNFEGLPTISVTTLQDVDGNSIVDGGENLVNSFQSFVPFSYPGITEIRERSYGPTSNALDIQVTVEKSPVQTKVLGTTYVLFQTSNEIAASDYTYGDAEGFYAPNVWASVKVTGTGTSTAGETFSAGQGFRGFRTDADSNSGLLTSTGWGVASFLRYNGQDVVIDPLDINWTLDIDQGPPDPVGFKWVSDCRVTLAFDDVDGNQYYKKTIVVTDVIPTQLDTASLPYT